MNMRSNCDVTKTVPTNKWSPHATEWNPSWKFFAYATGASKHRHPKKRFDTFLNLLVFQKIIVLVCLHLSGRQSSGNNSLRKSACKTSYFFGLIPSAECELWTQYFDVDKPNDADDCDCESLQEIRKVFPNSVCENPTKYDVRVVNEDETYYRFVVIALSQLHRREDRNLKWVN